MKLFLQAVSLAAIISAAVPFYLDSQVIAQESVARAVSNKAQSTTVQITDLQNLSGSGVIIDRENSTHWVLTNWHVVEEQRQYKIHTPDKKTHSVNYQKVKRVGNLDLAIISFESDIPYQYAAIGDSDQINLAQRVFISGWLNPMDGISQTTFQCNDGSVTGVIVIAEEGGYAITLSARGASLGMSGGSVLNSQGEVVGIFGRVAKHLTAGQGPYLAIPINAFMKSEYGIKFRKVRAPSPPGIEFPIVGDDLVIPSPPVEYPTETQLPDIRIRSDR